MKCQHRDCDNEASGGVVLRVPAVGCPIPEHEPLRVVVGLAVCATHFAELKPADFFTADGRLKQLVRMQCKSAGRAAPDFDRAFMQSIPFDSPEWTALANHRKT